ncbi:Oidioi.mRNA.OKI2018_I69.XSR.g16839.t1.cds [Oikopleura dioica]|uniref:Oidioi.mRNA.OKI2018_I69.XSR.g16839.t1.cds n=1 Tax=Oikopleura dioica TaxID=34765 RepID=A0ABN7SPN6_OIKDI|nr:Oidioi.mRNA.OKI2018_I69.XSR.g16839.t1.cds [Oikopleura dioica]
MAKKPILRNQRKRIIIDDEVSYLVPVNFGNATHEPTLFESIMSVFRQTAFIWILAFFVVVVFSIFGITLIKNIFV